MDKIIQTLNLPTRSWCLHIGAGHLEELATYKRLGIKPVWVEARPSAVIDAKCTWPFETIIQACVAGKTGEITKFVETRDGSKSGLVVDETKVKVLGYRHIKTITLPDLLTANRYPEARFALLVLSTEGTELDIIRTISTNMWDHLEAVIVHFNNPMQQKYIQEVLSCLLETIYVIDEWVVGRK